MSIKSVREHVIRKMDIADPTNDRAWRRLKLNLKIPDKNVVSAGVGKADKM